MFHALTNDSKQQAGSTKMNLSPQQQDAYPTFDWSQALGMPTVAGQSLAPPASVSRRKQKLMRLQRAYGNQAVLRMLERSRPAIQPKLVVNQPGDAYEQEADRVADQLVRMPNPDLSVALAPVKLSRKCAACEEEERKVQTKPAEAPKSGPLEAPGIVHEVLRSPGQPLDAATRAFFEPRFGYDFSQVRLHTDAKAAQSSQAVGALAYTVGNHIVLGETQQPRAPSCNALLAHELTHVIQQEGLAATGKGLPLGASFQPASPQVQRQQSDSDTVCHYCTLDGGLGVCCLPYTAAEAPSADECWSRYCIPDCTSDPAFCSFCNCLGPAWCTCTGMV